jgi:hypothetical protein
MTDTDETRGGGFLIKNATAILGFLGFAWGVVTYQVQSNKELEQQRMNLSHTFREERLHLYLDAVDLAATLATSPPSTEEWRKARASFHRTYWGRLSVVEDSGVRVAAVNFSKALGSVFRPEAGQEGRRRDCRRVRSCDGWDSSAVSAVSSHAGSCTLAPCKRVCVRRLGSGSHGVEAQEPG